MKPFNLIILIMCLNLSGCLKTFYHKQVCTADNRVDVAGLTGSFQVLLKKNDKPLYWASPDEKISLEFSHVGLGIYRGYFFVSDINYDPYLEASYLYTCKVDGKLIAELRMLTVKPFIYAMGSLENTSNDAFEFSFPEVSHEHLDKLGIKYVAPPETPFNFICDHKHPSENEKQLEHRAEHKDHPEISASDIMKVFFGDNLSNTKVTLVRDDSDSDSVSLAKQYRELQKAKAEAKKARELARIRSKALYAATNIQKAVERDIISLGSKKKNRSLVSGLKRLSDKLDDFIDMLHDDKYTKAQLFTKAKSIRSLMESIASSTGSYSGTLDAFFLRRGGVNLVSVFW